MTTRRNELAALVALLWCVSTHLAQAQTATAHLSAADTVRQGERLRLVYELHDVDPGAFALPDLVGLRVLGAPSRQTSMSIRNGVRSSSARLVYLLEATQPGLALVPAVTFGRGEASAGSEDPPVSTDDLTVFVVADPEYRPGQQTMPATPQPPAPPRRRRRPRVRL